MSLTYGYDLKDKNDQIIVAPVRATELVSRLIVPGALLVNHIPFCAEAQSIAPVPLPYNVFSATYASVGAMVQLRVTGTERQRTQLQDDKRAV